MNLGARRRVMWILGLLVVTLFVSGAVWRATHPRTSENPDEDTQIASRQDGYYLCLHRRQMSAAQMYRLVKIKLPHDDLTLALRGCQEAQRGSGD
jgi:hypothetical protein